ncbi:hypothetical protein TSAR_005471 [Trichomalopsis sarcophagae]|uniref:DNA/RNA non-specific endonuclease domain-containing protein n=1 Tax=Trichomalopsis sarcophagae TaxID=543379 RepID=A0A232FE50_9HYME|nr:hypothetical protein TSAR_005471 [Trichomalopsis sarcophagae]
MNSPIEYGLSSRLSLKKLKTKKSLISSDDLKPNKTKKEATDYPKNNIQKRSIYYEIYPHYHTLDDYLHDHFNSAIDQSEKISINSNTTTNGTEFCAIDIKQLSEKHALIIEYKSDIMKRNYLNVMELFINKNNLSPNYAISTISGMIAGGQDEVKWREFTDINSNGKQAYASQKQENSPFRNQLKCLNSQSNKCTYFSEDKNRKFVPAQLVHPSSFLYKVGGLTTFLYSNTNPQWPSIDKGLRTDLNIYTGTFDKLKLIDHADAYLEKSIFLNPYEKQKIKYSIPIPQYFWKIAYDPVHEQGVVFVTVNNPFIVHGPDYHLCKYSRSEQPNVLMPKGWNPNNITEGYSYICDLSDFLRSTNLNIKGLKNDNGLLYLPSIRHYISADNSNEVSLDQKDDDSEPDTDDYFDSEYCSISIDSLSVNKPLPIKNWTYKEFAHFYYPNYQGDIIITEGSVVTFMCPGDNNFKYPIYDSSRGNVNQYHKFICLEGKFELNGEEYDLNGLTCENNLSFDIEKNDTSIDGSITSYWLRFSYVDQKVNLIQIYYDNTISSTLYVQYPIRRSIRGRQELVKTLNREFDDIGCCSGLNMNDLYSPKRNFTKFSCYENICAEYQILALREGGYFTPAQLAPPTHLHFEAIANVTFTYLNTRPMWKTIFRGNWALLDEEEIMVYSGASGQFEFVSKHLLHLQGVCPQNH